MLQSSVRYHIRPYLSQESPLGTMAEIVGAGAPRSAQKIFFQGSLTLLEK